VWLYPGQWRSHYAEELLDLFTRRPPTWADVWDLMRNLCYTYMHPDLALTGEESPTERLVFLMRTLRTCEIVVFCAFVVMVTADFQFGGLVDGGPYAPLVGSGASWPIIQFEPGNGLSLAMAFQSIGLDLAFLGVLAGGLPLAVMAWRNTPQIRKFFVVPLVSLIAAILPAPIAFLLRGPVATINLTFATPITIAYLLWFVLLATASVWAIAHAIASTDVPDQWLRFAFVPSIVVAVALVLILGATVVWGIIAHEQVPHLFDQSDLRAGYVTLITWAIDVGVMAVAALLAVLAVLRGMAIPTKAPRTQGVADAA